MNVNVSGETAGKKELNPLLLPPHTPDGAPTLPLPAAKLTPPVLSPTHIPRPRLTDRLNPTPHAHVALAVAPPGSGKSSLVSQWCQQQPQGSVAWLSLDAEDNDPARFLLTLCVALESVTPEAAARVRSHLHSPPEPDLQAALTYLLRGLGTLSPWVTLVLDDYHAVEARAVHDLVAFMIEYLPPNLYLILIARSDPPLSFPRLRRMERLIDIRDADLRFTAEEASRFLNGRMGLPLTREAVTRLTERTEGWVAGLQMAACALRGETDPNRFLDSFTATPRYLVDYLVEAVQHRHPPEVERGESWFRSQPFFACVLRA
jgi:LuxR family maltose regulon positive regulatory protein